MSSLDKRYNYSDISEAADSYEQVLKQMTLPEDEVDWATDPMEYTQLRDAYEGYRVMAKAVLAKFDRY